VKKLIINPNYEVVYLGDRIVVFTEEMEVVYVLEHIPEDLIKIFETPIIYCKSLELARNLYDDSFIQDEYCQFVNELKDKSILIELE